MPQGNGWDELIAAYKVGTRKSRSAASDEILPSYGDVIEKLNDISTQLDQIRFLLWDRKDIKL